MRRRGLLLLAVNVVTTVAILLLLYALAPTRRAQGADTNARWSRADLPVQVLVAPEALDHHGSIARAVLIVNRACSCELLAFPVPASLVYVKDWSRGGHGIRGTILVRADGEAEPPRAHAEPSFSRPGRLYAVLITLPRARLPEWIVRGMILHEAMHAAGLLRHSDDPGSVMFMAVLPGQRVQRMERAFLRDYQ